jgi:hypothetical protein
MKMLQHFCISGRTNLTHIYVCFLMYTDNFHHKFFYHIWYNENPYPLTPYLNTNSTIFPSKTTQIHASSQWVLLSHGYQLSDVYLLHVFKDRAQAVVLSFSGIIVMHQLSDSSFAQSVKPFYHSTKFFIIRKLLRVPDISYYRSLRS